MLLLMILHRATRGIVRSVVLLAVGVVCNVLIAWAAAAWGDVPSARNTLHPASGAWPMPVPKGLSDALQAATAARFPGMVWASGRVGGLYTGQEPADQSEASTLFATEVVAYSEGAETSIAVPGRAEFGMTVIQFGWPRRALGHGRIWGRSVPYDSLLFDGLKVPAVLAADRRLPLYPLWPGFALNTLFYAAIAWGLWQVPLAIRRRRRRRANKCITCGYDRAGLAPDAACPECGSNA